MTSKKPAAAKRSTLRLRQSHPLLGIIMLTARSALADRVKGLNAGADLYLVKPVDMGELAAAIQTVARRVEASAEAPSRGAH